MYGVDKATNENAANPMIKILFVSHSSDMLGAEKAMVLLAQKLDPQRFRSIVVVPGDGQLLDELCRLSIPAHIINRRFAGIGWRTIMSLSVWDKLQYFREIVQYCVELIGFINKQDIDVVHINTVMEVFAGFAALFSGRPILWHIHESPPAPALGALSRIIWWLSDSVIANSKATISQMKWDKRPRGEGHKLQLVYYGISLSEPLLHSTVVSIRREMSISESATIVGLVGHLTPRKGVDVFAQAAHLVHKHFPTNHFLFIGNFSDPGYETKIKELVGNSLLTLCHFTGFRTDVQELMMAMDIIVVPSRSEPFGWVVIEGMAAGKPVIASRVGGIPEIIVDGKAGLLVTPDQPEELSNTICQLLAHPKMRVQMGIQSRKRIEQMFSEGDYISALTATYIKLAGRSSRKSREM